MADTSSHARPGHAAHHAAESAGTDHSTPPEVDPRTSWEGRYSESDRIWSGRVNTALAAVAGGLPPGRALDLGCGEGGDSVWLAEGGWGGTGVDLSTTALARAAALVVPPLVPGRAGARQRLRPSGAGGCGVQDER